MDALPHPVPYQGSKRRLAARILDVADGRTFDTLYEPFAGSAAVSLAAVDRGIAGRVVLGDSLAALADLWTAVLADPKPLADGYARLWAERPEDPRGQYLRVRTAFNLHGGPDRLLYLLARCVKSAPRFNAAGAFNQTADHRRRGRRPETMRREIEGAHRLLARRATVRRADFAALIAPATPSDLVYLDPPWEGTTTGTDRRYHAGLARERLVDALEDLDARGVPYVLSYDGRHGDKEYGEPLPASIGATRHELHAGRSSQATLNGRSVTTVESLYVSRHVAAP